MSQTNYSSYKYNPNEIDEKEFLEKFVIRNDIFEDIFEDIKNVDFNVANQHYIIVGKRGQGKTSLLRRVAIAIKNDEELSTFMIPIKFSEEQYQIRSLCRFFEVIAEELQENSSEFFPTILDTIESHINDENYDSKCFEYFEDTVKSKKKKLIILSDNIDELLGKLKEKEQRQLRQILITSSTIRIIGASTKMIEQHFDYAKPFYEYFKTVKLDGLDSDESIRFLRVIGDKEQNKKIEEIIENSPQRIETLRQLTGGVPRTLVMLYDIFIKNSETAFEDLLKVLDDVTLLYKDRMDNLPSILQDIVHNIAINWDGITTKELAIKTRLESKSVSSQLKQLEKYHIIEFESIGKNKIYKIKERFFNIWYLMRFGRKKDRNRVQWLVKFLTSWYDRDELNIKAKDLMNSIKNKHLNENYIYNMCEALSYAGLDVAVEHNMKLRVKERLSEQKSSFKNDVSKSDAEILSEAINLEKNGNTNEAIILLEKSQKSSNTILKIMAFLYNQLNQYQKEEKTYQKIIESGDNYPLIYLGNLYYTQKEYEKAREYYLKAIDSGNNNAFNFIAILCCIQKEYEKAEEYYTKAIESGDNNAFAGMSLLYFFQNIKIDKAVELVQTSYSKQKNLYTTHTLSLILLWKDNLEESYVIFLEFLIYDNTLEFENNITLYLILLISKGQFYKAKEFLELPQYQLKERYKPIWYALMTLMEKDFPSEIKKMGSELKQSVGEILEVIEEYKVKYTL